MYSDEINKSVAEAVRKIMTGQEVTEKLHPNQQKIDVVDDEKIDAKDFAKLRAMKNKVKEEVEQVEQVEEGIEDRLEAARAKAKAAGKPIKDKAPAAKSNVRKIEGGAYGGSKQKDEVEPDDEDDTPKKAVKKGTFKRRYNTKTYKESFTDRLDAYQEGGLKSLLETMEYEIVEEEVVEEESTNDEFTKELEDAKAKDSGAKKNKKISEPAVQAVKNEEVEQIEERHLTAVETEKKEHIVKSMKKGLDGFKERYGKDAKSVMYATATKQAKGE